MKRLLTPGLVLSTLFCVIAFSPLCATDLSGSISGKVIDAHTGEELPGVTVQLEGTSTGVHTNLNGEFILRDVPPGNYNLLFAFLSYKTKKVTEVAVQPGKLTEMNVTLDEDVVEVGGGEEVEIVASRITNTVASVLMEQKEAKVVASGIGSQQIQKSQDRDAAEVARRVPGVTVIDNRFVMVRGLTERYNAVMLNRALAPSFEADVRSFSFDVIPSGLIDRLMIYKSPSPDLPGEFAGGVVNVFTRNIPDNRLFLSFDMGLGYRTGTTGKRTLQTEKSETDWLGYDNGLRHLSEGFADNVRNVTDPGELQSLGRSLPNTWALNDEHAAPDQSMGIGFGRKYQLKKVTLGGFLAVNYGNANSTYRSERMDYNIYDETLNESDTIFHYNDSIFQSRTRLGIMLNLGLRAGKNQIELKNFFNQTGLQENTLRNGVNGEEGNYRKEYGLRYNQRTIYSGQVSSTHELFSDRGTLDLVAGFSTTRRSDPDWKRIRYTKPLDGSYPEYQAYVPFSAQPFYLGRLYIDLEENIPMAAFNYEHKLFIIEEGDEYDEPNWLSVKVGAYAEDKKRTFAVRNLGYAAASIATYSNSALIEESVGTILAPENINTINGFKLDEDTKGSDSYSAGNRQLNYYIMANVPYGHWNLSGGVRFEDNRQTLNSKTLTGKDLEVVNDTLVALPSFNLSYNLTEQSLVRVALGKTVNRPEFREIAPYFFYDFVFNSIYSGNDSLKFSTVRNFDVRYEVYPHPSEVFSVGFFYKKFINPIELYFAPGVGSGGTRSFIPGNAESATSYGVEMDVRKSLGGLSSARWLNSFSLVANASWIESDITLSRQSAETGLNASRPMMGQSPYIVNAGLYYQNDSIGLSVSCLYNVIGPRVVIVGIPGIPEVYEMPRNQIDLTITKSINRMWSVRFGVQDLLSQDFVLLQDANEDGVLSTDSDQRMQSYNKGRVFQFAVQYRFIKN